MGTINQGVRLLIKDPEGQAVALLIAYYPEPECCPVRDRSSNPMVPCLTRKLGSWWGCSFRGKAESGPVNRQVAIVRHYSAKS